MAGVVPRRVVCLVPSITELLFALGAAAGLVGRTRYCEEPSGQVDAVETVGGTKNPDCERIIELAPELVIVNREENRIEDFQRLEAAGLARGAGGHIRPLRSQQHARPGSRGREGAGVSPGHRAKSRSAEPEDHQQFEQGATRWECQQRHEGAQGSGIELRNVFHRVG